MNCQNTDAALKWFDRVEKHSDKITRKLMKQKSIKNAGNCEWMFRKRACLLLLIFNELIHNKINLFYLLKRQFNIQNFCSFLWYINICSQNLASWSSLSYVWLWSLDRSLSTEDLKFMVLNLSFSQNCTVKLYAINFLLWK